MPCDCDEKQIAVELARIGDQIWLDHFLENQASDKQQNSTPLILISGSFFVIFLVYWKFGL